MQVIYRVTVKAEPAVRLCSEAGSTVRRAAAEVALTSEVQGFQIVEPCRAEGTCGGKEGRFAARSRSARATNHRLRMTAKPTQIAAQSTSWIEV